MWRQSVSKLEYDTSKIELSAVSQGKGLLDKLEVLIEDAISRQEILEDELKSITDESKEAALQKMTAFSDISTTVSTWFRRARTVDRVQTELDLVKDLKFKLTAEYFEQGIQTKRQIVSEMAVFYLPYKQQLSISTAAQTDEVARELNIMLVEFIEQYNHLLIKSEWFDSMKLVQESHFGKQFSVLSISDHDLVELQGAELLQLIGK